jgi:hypothetical protein
VFAGPWIVMFILTLLILPCWLCVVFIQYFFAYLDTQQLRGFLDQLDLQVPLGLRQAGNLY